MGKSIMCMQETVITPALEFYGMHHRFVGHI